MQAGVKAADRWLSRAEQVTWSELLPAFWEPGGQEVTPTMKLGRRLIADRYAAETEGLYREP